jgi:FtsH-binding integral membrane protein
MNSFVIEKASAQQAQLIRKVYTWMFAALLITAGVAYRVSTSEQILGMIFASKLSFYGLIIAQIGIVWYLSSRIQALSLLTATILFAAYSILMGVTMSAIFVVYTQASISSTFLITACTFGVMSLYGYTTKKDLTSWGGILLMAVVGLIIASVVNIFLASSMFEFIISCIGVLIFVGLTAYDTQKIKALLENHQDNEEGQKIALLGSLTLYLDFINLFLFLLRLLGNRK